MADRGFTVVGFKLRNRGVHKIRGMFFFIIIMNSFSGVLTEK